MGSNDTNRACGGWRWLAVVALVLHGGVAGAQAPTGGAADYRIVPPFAWNRADRYEPPNYKAFFPDDVEGGKQLDLWLEGKLKLSDTDEQLALIRRGLRNTSHYRTNLLGSIGNRFVWNQDKQEPRAIELLYQASASDDEGAHSALYHGPTVVSQRTPNLVRMLMEQYQSLDSQMQGRIAWGMKTYGDREQSRKLLESLLDDYKNLDAGTVAAAIDTYQAVFETRPPGMERFEQDGLWVIAFHRTDLSADHPRAAEILREDLVVPFRGREKQLVDIVTRVDDGHETAVLLVQGAGPRDDLIKYFSAHVRVRIDFNELLSARTLRERRLREFARHLPAGMPEHALPPYTRPPLDGKYAYDADEFVAPDFVAYFPDDASAGAELDAAYRSRDELKLSDSQLLELFRRGLRRSSVSPNELFGWLSAALGWPRDPRLTEIFYQAMDPAAPLKVREAGIYYGFGLGTAKTKNVLEGMYRVYMAPPFDRRTSSNLRSRILWGVRDHEDDKQYLAERFAEALANHATLSDAALQQADTAYRALTSQEPPRANEYASRGVYLVVFSDATWDSIEKEKEHLAPLLGDAQEVLETKYSRDGDRIIVVAAVRGAGGMRSLIEQLRDKPGIEILAADLLTRELIDQSEGGELREFERLLPAER